MNNNLKKYLEQLEFIKFVQYIVDIPNLKLDIGEPKLTIDDKGLFIHAELIDTTSNRDIYKSIQAKLLDKMSFAFTVEAEENDYETDTRRILQFDKIFDVSIVDVPFYDSTEVFARNLEKSESRFLEGKKKYDELRLEKEKLSVILKCI